MSRFRKLGLAVFCLCACMRVTALDVTLDGSATLGTESPNPYWAAMDIRASHAVSDFSFLWDISVSTDGSYGGLFSGRLGLGGVTLRVQEGGLAWKRDKLTIQAGKLAMHDEIDSPYSLFLSSRGNSVPGLFFSYEDEQFFFNDRWAALNYNSADQACGGCVSQRQL